MKKFLFIGLNLLSLALFGQNSKAILDSLQRDLKDQEGDLTEKAAPIVAEGKLLYRIEMASWQGTEIFMQHYKETENIGGYFSYPAGDMTKCIYFSKKYDPKVIGTITFDSTYNMETAAVDLTEREFNANETSIFLMRRTALNMINTDAFFKSYANMSLNLSPLINGSSKKVYILTASNEDNMILIGNDYMLTYDQDNNLLGKKILHPNTIPFNLGKADENVETTQHVHYPENGDFITATDVCTLMMYEKYTKWKVHNVISKNCLNIWNCETNKLVVFSKERLDEIARLEKEAKKNLKKEEKEANKRKKGKGGKEKESELAKIAPFESQAGLKPVSLK